jgi:pyruvate/2-oxoglutarate dehydrogenase complex dihydrolipoamide dehydrogenase (E3) component
MKKNKIDHIQGNARLVRHNTIEVSSGGSGTEVITARHIIIATGASPRSVPASH